VDRSLNLTRNTVSVQGASRGDRWGPRPTGTKEKTVLGRKILVRRSSTPRKSMRGSWAGIKKGKNCVHKIGGKNGKTGPKVGKCPEKGLGGTTG